MRLILLSTFLSLPLWLVWGAPPELRPQEGLRENVPTVHALTGARVVPRPGEVIENGTVLLREGLIQAVGEKVDLPADARIWDLTGLTIYPGFIDAYAAFGTATSSSPEAVPPSHWNPSVRPEQSVLHAQTFSEKDVEARRKLGFAAAHWVPANEGVFRGSGALLQLTSREDPGLVLNRQLAQHVSFNTRSRDYPRSLMGCVALVRQTLADAQWFHAYQKAYRKDPQEVRPGENEALRALGPVVQRGRLPVFFRLRDETDGERAKGLADAFGVRSVFVDSGHAYRHWQTFKGKRRPVVLTMDFPKAPAVSDPDRMLDVSLEQLQHWEWAPSTPGILEAKEVHFALSTHRLEDSLDRFWPNVRRAVKHGLSPERALEALTVAPAGLLGEAHRLGEIASGKLAHLTVTSGDLFQDKEAKIRQVWIDGHPWLDEREAAPVSGAGGRWETSWSGVEGPRSFEIAASGEKLKLTLGERGSDDEETKASEAEPKVQQIGRDGLQFSLPASAFAGKDGMVRLSAYLNQKTMVGQGVTPEGRRFSWSARRVSRASGEDESKELPGGVATSPEASFAQYPAGAFPGNPPEERRPRKRVFIEDATVWTCGPQGVLHEADVVIEKGRIFAIGTELKPEKKDHVIDGRGKHVTPGLVDCHSHTAIHRGVNEGSHAVTCEVRIGDVLDPTDISLYRQLAGGLTTANLLHGSANPMGGQNQVIKLRWGAGAEALKFEGAKPGVKFALGENVKQSNWGEDYTTRYPQTRMGVEQLMRDTFMAAREYEARKRRHAEQGGAFPFRTNYRLEAVAEILRGERLVHIHSYRQDEILMFVRLAQEFGFTVGTFQHVLEGYKVARHLREIDAGASSFSDWWAYKFEVYDAIPHNGALLHEAGVLTSFNSDDSELATRLNTEAAKAVKYGGVSPEEALKFVTLNPAKQLRIDHRVGSLEVGKDADFVLWSGPPLSTLSRCEQTWIEGARYFHADADRERRVWVEEERRRLIAKVLAGGEEEESAKGKEDRSKTTLSKADQRRLLSPWGQYQAIDYQELYHDGQSLHLCTGCYCDFR